MVKDENYWEEIYKSLLEEYHELETQLGQKEEEIKRLKAQLEVAMSRTTTVIEAVEEPAGQARVPQFDGGVQRTHLRGEDRQSPIGMPHHPAEVQPPHHPASSAAPPVHAASLATVSRRPGVKRSFFQRAWSLFFDPILRI